MSEEKTTLSEKELKKVFYFWFSAFVRLSFSYVVPFRFEILVLSRTFLPIPLLSWGSFHGALDIYTSNIDKMLREACPSF